MPTWPTKPEWIDPSNINKGNEYVAADGVTVTDMNSIINDLLYLKEHGTGGSVRKITTSAEVLRMISSNVIAKIPKITTQVKGEVTT